LVVDVLIMIATIYLVLVGGGKGMLITVCKQALLETKLRLRLDLTRLPPE